MIEGHLITAVENENIVGGAVVFIDENKGDLYIGRIFISPNCHRKGYGTDLMKGLEKQFSDCAVVYLDTPIWNIRTNSFYRKLGYIEVKKDSEFVYYKKCLK